MRISDWSSDVCSSDLFTDGVGTQLVVEITESITDSLLALRWPVLSQLNRVQYAMDDFGDDYSSMQRLIRYPWDYCKFDRSEERSVGKSVSVRVDLGGRLMIKKKKKKKTESRIK